MTPSGLISFLLALRRGIPAAGTHYRLAQVKPWIHLCLSSQLPLHRTLASQKRRPGHRLTRCLAAPSLQSHRSGEEAKFPFSTGCVKTRSGLGFICRRLEEIH